MTNNDGELKVVDAKGNIKWFAPILANNGLRMKEMGFEISPDPVFAGSDETYSEQAIQGPAKRGPKPKNK